VELISLVLVGGFRNISVEHSASIAICGEVQTEPLSQRNSLLYRKCSGPRSLVTRDQFHPVTGMKVVTQDADTTVE
jgi:hypothetical protein